MLLAGVTLALRPGAAPAAVPQGQPGPVLLIPGYGGDTSSLSVLAARLAAAGRRVTVVPLPGDGTGDLNAQAQALAAAVRAAQGSAPSVDLVGYSAGGVVARLYVRSYGGAGHVRRVVSLGSPQHGAVLAASADALVPGACVDACAQLLPGSALLRALNRGDETPAGPLWMSVWTEQDQTVRPPDSARLAGALNVDLQQACPGAQVSHGGLPRDPLVIGLVLSALGPAAPAAPRDCPALRAAGGG
ncbi:MAG TPA: alpha/beta fold hydrolase [Mycobacteriales bacterium]|nr:alpha/beta fold hydrolase [Mycobacteriales bacterium]